MFSLDTSSGSFRVIPESMETTCVICPFQCVLLQEHCGLLSSAAIEIQTPLDHFLAITIVQALSRCFFHVLR